MTRKITDEIVENRKRISDIYSETDTSINPDNIERIDYTESRYGLESKTTINGQL